MSTRSEIELPNGRFVRGVTTTPLGEISVLGLCIRWKDARVQTVRKNRQPWEDHAVYLRALASVLSMAPRQRLIVLGDFNQTIPRTRAPLEKYDLSRHLLGGLRFATAGASDDLALPRID